MYCHWNRICSASFSFFFSPAIRVVCIRSWWWCLVPSSCWALLFEFETRQKQSRTKSYYRCAVARRCLPNKYPGKMLISLCRYIAPDVNEENRGIRQKYIFHREWRELNWMALCLAFSPWVFHPVFHYFSIVCVAEFNWRILLNRIWK